MSKKSQLVRFPPSLPLKICNSRKGGTSNEDKTWNFLEYSFLSLVKFGKQMAVKPRLWCEVIKVLLSGQRGRASLISFKKQHSQLDRGETEYFFNFFPDRGS